jgi:CheY-like chemotaxis protein
MASNTGRASPLIVLVDDAEGVRFALTELLENNGFRVMALAGGQQALKWLTDLADGERPAAFVIDLVMDDVNGFEVLTAAKTALPSIPILAISGGTRNLAPDLPLELAEQTGADACLHACLQKPFANEAFLETVRTLIKTKSVAGQKMVDDRT